LKKKLSLLFILLVVGCASYQTNVDSARKKMAGHDSIGAAKALEPLAKKESDDQLVYVFDYATALQTAGQYKESNSAFMLADRLSDLKNYLSITRTAGSLVFNEGMVQYKGEDFERLMINMMEALNFLMLGDHENALVEVRALNDKLEYYRLEQKKQYEQNTMAIYLSALMWEDDHNYDNAYIMYEKAYNRDGRIPMLRYDLVRTAKLSSREDAYEKWSKEFGIKYNPEWSNHSYGELVLIFEQGWGPRKGPRRGAPRFPQLFPYYTSTRSARLDIEGFNPISTQVVYNVQDVAIKTLDDEYAALVAKRLAGVATKAVIADQVAQHNQLLGALVGLGLNASDQADLRQWSTLPETFQVARVLVPGGKYNVSVQGMGTVGPSADFRPPEQMEVRPGKKTFFIWRSFH
jgi:uncharacterized protein